ncbi:MAG: MFS transporter [Chloroflexia bacterium]|nr:MFS transporter [Chloroflexia bacterium]
MNSLFRIAGFVFGIPLGMLIDRRGALRILFFGISIYAVGWALLLTWSDIRIIAPVYFLIGAANIATYTAIIPLLSSVIEPQQRATLFGINAGATVAVGFVGSLFGGALPGLVAPLLNVSATDSLAYRVALFSVTIIGLIAIVPLLGVHAAVTKQQSDGRLAVSTADQTAIPFLRIMGFASQSLLLGVAGGLVVPFQNLFYRQQFQLDDATVGMVLALSAFAMGFGSTIGGMMAKRFGLRRATALSRLLSAPTLLLMLVPSLWVSCLAYFLSRIMVGITFPLADALVMQSVPIKQRGTSTSLSSMLWSLGWAGTAYLSGFIQRDYGFYWVFIASATAYAVNAAMFYLIPFKDEGH